jgi:EmrB/QacA subfamily drug resistance transporter
MNTRKRAFIMFNLVVTCIASSFLQTALTTALPPVISELHISLSDGQWLTSGYSLAMGIMMPLTAFLITRCQTKKLYVGAIGIFLVGLIVCIFATNFPLMMFGRILQACSNGITTSMAQVVLLTIYPPEKRGTVMGWYGLSVGAAPVIAPTIAGILVDTLGWRTIFIITFVILMLSFIMALTIFDNVLETKIKAFDVYSFILSALTFGGITLGIGNLSAHGAASAMTVWPLAIGLVAGVLFTHRQLKLEEPFLNLRILKVQKYRLSVIGSMMLYLVMMGSSVIMPLYVQSILGKSATISGLVTLPGSLVMAVVSPFAGKIYDKFGMKRLAIVGTLMMIISTLGMSFITINTSVLLAAFLNVIRSVAIGCLMMPFVTYGISSMGADNTAHGTALLTSLRTIAGAIGTAVFVGILNVCGTSTIALSYDNPKIYGLRVTFGCMTAVTVIMLLIIIFRMKGKIEFITDRIC